MYHGGLGLGRQLDVALVPLLTRTLCIDLRQGPRGVRFLVSKVPLYGVPILGSLTYKKTIQGYLADKKTCGVPWWAGAGRHLKVAL